MLQPTKCKFFKTSVVYVGHEISMKGIQTNACKVEAIKNWPILSIVIDLCSFLGFMNYYQCFIKGYVVTHLLYDQSSGNNATQKKKKIFCG